MVRRFHDLRPDQAAFLAFWSGTCQDLVFKEPEHGKCVACCLAFRLVRLLQFVVLFFKLPVCQVQAVVRLGQLFVGFAEQGIGIGQILVLAFDHAGDDS